MAHFLLKLSAKRGFCYSYYKVAEQQVPQTYEHNLPFHVDMLAPKFPYVAHSGFSKLMFALIVGLSLAGLLLLLYYLFY